MNYIQAIIKDAFRLPEYATAIEATVGQAMLKHKGPNAGKTPAGKANIGKNPRRSFIAEKRRQSLLKRCTNEWQLKLDVVQGIGFDDSCARSSIDSLTREGRLEAEKFKGKIYVRLPQENAAV